MDSVLRRRVRVGLAGHLIERDELLARRPLATHLVERQKSRLRDREPRKLELPQATVPVLFDELRPGCLGQLRGMLKRNPEREERNDNRSIVLTYQIGPIIGQTRGCAYGRSAAHIHQPSVLASGRRHVRRTIEKVRRYRPSIHVSLMSAIFFAFQAERWERDRPRTDAPRVRACARSPLRKIAFLVPMF